VLQAVSAVSDDVAWVTGHAGVVLRTTDGGATWRRLAVPDADSLEFRDVRAFGPELAYVLAAGRGTRSRIYVTSDGGRHWELRFANADPRAFYDCFAFFDRRRAVAVSDAVDGHIVLRATDDGGAHWNLVPPGGIPVAEPGEGAFAASGTCIVALGRSHAWIGTGSAAASRVYRSVDGGRRWRVAATPVVAGAAAGVTSLAFRDERHGVALGGAIAAPADTGARVAVTTDGGTTWRRGGDPPFNGAIYGAAYVPGAVPPALVVVGPGGMAQSRDDGRTWVKLSADPYWAVGFASPRAGWAVGPAGRITRIRLE
jgi:photosystem II stability/assembly factor-like uncharacterized protein